MSQIEMETRLIGKEDIAFDESGIGATTNFTDSTGTQRTYHHINATHIPISAEARAVIQSASDVDSALIKLQSLIGGTSSGAGALTGNTTINLAADGSVSIWQTSIDSVAKNLNGYTLTVKFPSGSVSRTLENTLYFKRFYNGTLEIDLNEITFSDTSDINSMFGLEDLRCYAHISNGSLKHTYSQNAIKATRCQGVYLDSLSITGKSATTGSYAFYGINSDGYKSNTVTLVTDKLCSISSFITESFSSMVSDHNSSANAHSGYLEPAGTAATAVSTHNTADAPHPGKFETYGAVSTHNTSNDAHSALFAQKENTGIAASNVNAHNVYTGAHPNGFVHNLVVAKSDPVYAIKNNEATYGTGATLDKEGHFDFLDGSGNMVSQIIFGIAGNTTGSPGTHYTNFRVFNPTDSTHQTYKDFFVGYDKDGFGDILSDFNLVINNDDSGHPPFLIYKTDLSLSVAPSTQRTVILAAADDTAYHKIGYVDAFYKTDRSTGVGMWATNADDINKVSGLSITKYPGGSATITTYSSDNSPVCFSGCTANNCTASGGTLTNCTASGGTLTNCTASGGTLTNCTANTQISGNSTTLLANTEFVHNLSMVPDFDGTNWSSVTFGDGWVEATDNGFLHINYVTSISGIPTYLKLLVSLDRGVTLNVSCVLAKNFLHESGSHGAGHSHNAIVVPIKKGMWYKVFVTKSRDGLTHESSIIDVYGSTCTTVNSSTSTEWNDLIYFIPAV